MNYSSNTHIPSRPSKEEVLSKAIIKVALNLDLSQKEISEIIGSSKSEISRLFHGNTHILLNTKEGECALMLIRIYKSLDTLLGGDENQCKEWFNSYNNHLGEKPKEKAKKISGLVEIVIYLDAMRGLA